MLTAMNSQTKKLGTISYSVVKFSAPANLPQSFIVDSNTKSYRTVKSKERSKLTPSARF